jgi:hypothetical protein
MSRGPDELGYLGTGPRRLPLPRRTLRTGPPVRSRRGRHAVWNSTVFPVFSETAWRTLSALIPGIVLGALFRAYANHLMTTLKD